MRAKHSVNRPLPGKQKHVGEHTAYKIGHADPKAFTTSDVVELYLHRGADLPALADEDSEQDPDRWCSHAAWGQECWQLVSQWGCFLRLELGHQLEPTPIRITEFAPAIPPVAEQTAASPASASGYGPPATATSWKMGRFSGPDFPLQPDGTLRCPAGQALVAHERCRETDGSLRVVYAASMRSCRPCPQREQCQWQGSATKKPRQVSVLLHPLAVGPAPVLWRDWSRRLHRRERIQLLRHQRVEVQMESGRAASPSLSPAPLSRAQRGILVSTGKRASLAMDVLQALPSSRSSCSASLKPLLPGSA